MVTKHVVQLRAVCRNVFTACDDYMLLEDVSNTVINEASFVKLCGNCPEVCQEK